jgi:hypothetical protein
MRLLAWIAAGMVALSSAACGSAQAIRASDLEQRAQAFVDDALTRIQDRYPGCRPGSGAATPAFGRVKGAPSAWLVGLIGVLRRPQTSEEAAFASAVTARSRFFPFVGDRLYADATRLVAVDDGPRFAITVAQSVPNSMSTAIPYDRCTALRERELRRRLRDASKQLRRRAFAMDRDLARHGRPGPTPPDAIGLAGADSDELRAGGPMRAAWFKRDGLLGIAPVGGHTVVFGLVPDGVATVRVDVGKLQRRAAVHDNTFSVSLARAIDQGVPDRVRWLNSAGVQVNAFEPSVAYSDFARPS